MASTSTNFLAEKTVAALVEDKPKVQPILSSWSVEAATTFLRGSNFLSAPVVDKSTGEYIGFIDVIDLMLYACGISDAFMKCDQTVEQMKALESRWAEKKVADLIGLNDEDELLWSLSPETKLEKAVEVLHKGIHRLLVGDYVVTQTDLVRYLITAHTHNEIQLDSAQLSKKLSELETLGSSVKTVNASESALSAFAKMGADHLSALGVVNADGKLVGNLSASDIRGVTPDLYPCLLQDITKFWQTVHTDKWSGLSKHQDLVTVTDDTTLDQLLKEFSATRLHHVYLVDNDGKPKRAISLTDVIQLFCTQGC
eukprot:CAMPEP_0201552276 /NCGR_PEP_ID=MMETSP0173_2-20130828/14597_1 /ASSEMBLY_ACC=CAM_ASM_000268 /TAXON_ID=218659 /ORGANISM="Vexillifera sp., Strain DIVA3 564/2" /LENGTH=311 /DNA_ID=CAMNT_0047962729 /DNA_START=30 /DNA_END=965 /DNA_ORIENTATION=-